MILRMSNKTVYYPTSRREVELMRDSGRVRYFRGSILVSPKSVK
jgi:hypothetical protein